MNELDAAIIKCLKVNMGYKEGEKVVVVGQRWEEGLPVEIKPQLEISTRVTEEMMRVFLDHDINADICLYTPTELRHGADATEYVYNKAKDADILLLPTHFSLTHTNFRKAQTERGARVGSMPLFTLDLFEQNGPMDADYQKIAEETEALRTKTKEASYVHITAPGTNMWVEVPKEDKLFHADTGLFVSPGLLGNLPAGESFFVPGKGSSGYLTVPAGWGGPFALEHAVRFEVKDGRFVQATGETPAAQAYIEEKINPLLWSKPDYEVLAELGIGTNPNVTAEYIAKKGWSLLTAEKIIGSAHFANGRSSGMGGDNDVDIHIDWVVPGVTIEYK